MLKKLRSMAVLGAVLLAGMAAMHAGAQKVITVRVLDGKTGNKIVPDNVVVRINRQSAAHVEWVKMNDDGTAQLRLPDDATSFTVHASFESAMEFYVNCDVARQKDTSSDTWFPVADALQTGIAMPNECVKPKEADRIKVHPNPGEFILFVRKPNWRDAMHE